MFDLLGLQSDAYIQAMTFHQSVNVGGGITTIPNRTERTTSRRNKKKGDRKKKSKRKESRVSKNVTFSTIQVQEHGLIIGDYSQLIIPISLDWKHTEPILFGSIEEYENKKLCNVDEKNWDICSTRHRRDDKNRILKLSDDERKRRLLEASADNVEMVSKQVEEIEIKIENERKRRLTESPDSIELLSNELEAMQMKMHLENNIHYSKSVIRSKILSSAKVDKLSKYLGTTTTRHTSDFIYTTATGKATRRRKSQNSLIPTIPPLL